jgi:CDP-diacylglycerol--glycerol-3-phosphate 3-phosphatidyltransferase
MLDGRWRGNVERGLQPIGRGLHRLGITADGLTVIGLLFAVGTAFAIADGHLVLGVVGLVLTGLHDILDGSVARQSGRAGPRGAFFDSVCDRIADAAIFLGVAWYLADEGKYLPVLVLAVLALSMLITYERARAESLGFTARGGLMERAERLVLLGVGLAFDVLVPVLWIMLVLTAFTVVQRFLMVWRQATPDLGRRRARHARGSDLDEARAGGLAQWWAAHRPQAFAARDDGGRSEATPRPR